VCLLLLAAACDHAVGQTNVTGSASADWVVRTWQTKDGLPQNTPNAIVQSRDGYLWVGTTGGLARFDGARFRTFGLQDGLGSVQVFRLCEDRAGALWVGTVGGGLSRLENGRFTTFGKAEGFQAGTVQALAAASDGTLWIGTEAGLVRWQNGGFKAMGAAEGLPPAQVRALLLDSKGVLWVSALNKGLYRSSAGRFVAMQAPDPAPSSVYSLVEARDGSVWAGTWGQLWNWRDGSWKRYDSTNGLPQNEIRSLAEGSDGTVWVGAREDGLYNFKDGFAHPLTNSSSLTQASVGGLLVDQEGTLWVGITGEGLSRLSRRTLHHWGKAEGLASPHVSSVAEDRTGGLWVGTQNEGLRRFSGRQFSKLQDPVVGQNHQIVYSLVASDDGSTWAAGEQFLLRFSPERVTQAYLQPPIRGEAIRAMCADGTNLWLGTYYSTLIKVEGTNVVMAATNGSFGGGITSLELEGPEALWIGTSDGLHHWQRGEVKTWTTRDGLLTANIRALHRDSDGTLWIGTVGGGLARLKNGRITNITTRQGLVDDVISQIVTDDFGHLWLGSNRGIMCLNRWSLEDLADGKSALIHPIVFGVNEGMIKEQCSGGHSPTALKTKDGRLLFPTLSGLVEIDPRQLDTLTTNLPQAIIEEVMLDKQLQPPGATLVVPPGDRHVEVRYTAPSLRMGDWVRFRTRLQGLDPDWVMAGTRRTTSYAGLRPGRYVFQVTACDSKGVWNATAASLAVIVKPFFWQTPWFAMLISVTTVGLAVEWYRQRIGKLEIRRQAQETFTRQLIGAQEAERARLARELHDDITQRLAVLAIDTGRVERAGTTPEVNDTMRGVREGLVRLSEDVHSLSYRLHSSLLEDLGLAEALKAECERFSRQESIRAEVNLLDLPPTLPPDAALCLFRIAQEALRNVTRHAKARTVDVTLRAMDDGLQLAVRDNGIGFDPKRKREHLSLGLASMRERAGLLGGELDIESAPGYGTTIVAWVPLKTQKT